MKLLFGHMLQKKPTLQDEKTAVRYFSNNYNLQNIQVEDNPIYKFIFFPMKNAKDQNKIFQYIVHDQSSIESNIQGYWILDTQNPSDINIINEIQKYHQSFRGCT